MTDLPPALARDTPAYARASLALFLAGFSTFSLLYCVQPLLPEFAREFRVDPAGSSLALSLTTGALALAILGVGAFSDRLPRRGLMFASMAAGAVLNLAAAEAPAWWLLLAARSVEGLVLGGVPAVAMAYLAEEVHAGDLGQAMGRYVAGTAFGGMAGRVAVGLVAEHASWRAAMGWLGLLDLGAAIGFLLLLPPSRRFTVRRQPAPGGWSHLRHPGLVRLFLVAFVAMGLFVSLFNYAGFRLAEPPYSLGQGASAAVFLTYATGIVASAAAGSIADRHGRRLPLMAGFALMGTGALVTLLAPLAAVVVGITLVTIGFFAAHSVASGWVGRLAGAAKGRAAATYLLFYYAGSSLVGTAAGWVWAAGRWPALAGLCVALAATGLLLAAPIRER
jgi:MFS transporter, YNFM family, putative membrane transport protein